MPRVDYRAIWRTNRTEIAFFLPARGDAQALQVVAVIHRSEVTGRDGSRIVRRSGSNPTTLTTNSSCEVD
jgi:hypothetical protein